MNMNIRLIVWLLLFSHVFNSWALGGENTEQKIQEQQITRVVFPVDSLDFAIDPDCENGIFISPQPVAFTIRTDKPAASQSFRLICIVTTDMYLPVDSLTFTVKPDSTGMIIQPVCFVLPVAGFYRFSVYAENEGGKSRIKNFNLGYNPEKILSPPDMKDDFKDFWKITRAELNRVNPRFKMTLLEDKGSEIKTMYHVEMYSLGNVKIEGYYAVPKTKEKHPAIIKYQGYGANPRFPDPNAMPEFCEFILSVRGQGIQKPGNTYGDWIIYGLADKNDYYYRGAYMDLIRGIDFLSSRPEVDPEKIVTEGVSQGGAFALVACALDKRIKAASSCMPFLSDFRDYFKICPWPRSSFEKYLKKHPSANWEEIYDVLSYFDIKNLAGQITCPVIMGVGLQDDTCPPHTNFAGYNQIRSEKKYIVYPDRKHSVDEKWWQVREAFFREKLGISVSN